MSTTPALDVFDGIVDLCIAITRYAHQDEALTIPEMEQRSNDLFEFITPIIFSVLPGNLVKNLNESFHHEYKMKFGTDE